MHSVPPSTGSQPLQTETRIPELDGIRGLAISLVLFAHFVHDPMVPGINRFTDFIKDELTLGTTGVDLFFVLSGFLIGGILLDQRNSSGYFKPFYARRICRILPLYYLVIVACVAAGHVLSSHSAEQWYKSLFVTGVSTIGVYGTFTQDIVETIRYGTAQFNALWLAPTWSLTIEEQFYLLLPLVIRFVRPSWWLPASCIVVCLHPILYLFLWMYEPVVYIYTNLILPSRIDALLLGVICAWMVRQGKCRDWLVQYRGLLYVACGFLSLGALYFAHQAGRPNFQFDSLFAYSWMAFLYTAILLLAVTDKSGPVACVMRLGPLRKIGIIAYGVYLIHEPIIGLLHGLILGSDCRLENLAGALINCLALGATILLAAVSWKFFEKPIIKFGHAFPYDNSRQAVPENTLDVETTKQIQS